MRASVLRLQPAAVELIRVQRAVGIGVEHLESVRHGISTALTRYEPALRTTVKQAGFLTRDPRVVERKKYGRAKARRSFQFSKR